MADARELLAGLCVQPLIEKTRHIVTTPALVEIDEFRGAAGGLLVAEVELADECQEFTEPRGPAARSPLDPRYYNLSLVKRPYSEWGIGEEHAGGLSAESE